MSSFIMLSPSTNILFYGDWIPTVSPPNSKLLIYGGIPVSGYAIFPTFTGGTIDLGLGPIAIESIPSGFKVTDQIIGSPDNTCQGDSPAVTPDYYNSTIASFPDNTSFFILYTSLVIVNAGFFGTAGSSALISNNSASTIQGNYVIEAFTWYIEGGPEGGPYTSGPFVAGDIIRIVSPDTNPDLTTIDSITLLIGLNTITVTSENFTTWTSILIQFPLPRIPPTDSEPPVTISVFGGSVKIGNIIISIINASGIYQISSDKTCDTLYINSGGSDGTIDVAIPNPTIKTGFIGG